jgi:hypothetical protein
VGDGIQATLPFLDESLVQRRRQMPLRVAGGIVPVGLEKLYYIGMIAPRGPQIPIYGVQTKLAIRMIELHEAAAGGFAGIETYLAGLQEPFDGIDIVRVVWEDQMADTERLLDSLEQARSIDAMKSVRV